MYWLGALRPTSAANVWPSVVVGMERSKFVLQRPLVQAGKQLEAEGIACHLVLVYRCAWGAAWLHGH